ncbi:MAG: hypothetical protein HY760_00525 [Nitrospirae bacterium]|nr:hypothetical protein [Nitrospirota bacterium]
MNPCLCCKLRVASVTQSKDNQGNVYQEQVVLQAVYGPKGSENAAWSKYTPSATFSIYINNPAAFGKLPVDHEFLVNFIPVESKD